MRDVARWIIQLLPPEHRDRYGNEMLDLLDGSSRPAHDLIDVAAVTLRWHSEVVMRNPLSIVAATLAALSLFGAGYAVAELTGGVSELLEHWWSTLPIAGLLLAAGLAVLARARRQRLPAVAASDPNA